MTFVLWAGSLSCLLFCRHQAGDGEGPCDGRHGPGRPWGRGSRRAHQLRLRLLWRRLRLRGSLQECYLLSATSFFYIVARIIRYLCTSIVLIRSLNQCFRLGSGQSPDPTNKNIKQKVCCGNCVTFFKDWHIFLLALVQLQAKNTYQWIRIWVLKSRSWSLVSTTQIGQIKLTVSQDLFFKKAWLYFVVLHFEHSLRSGVLEPFIFGRVRL